MTCTVHTFVNESRHRGTYVTVYGDEIISLFKAWSVKQERSAKSERVRCYSSSYQLVLLAAIKGEGRGMCLLFVSNSVFHQLVW